MYTIDGFTRASKQLESLYEVWDDLNDGERKAYVQTANLSVLDGIRELAEKVQGGELVHTASTSSVRVFTERGVK